MRLDVLAMVGAAACGGGIQTTATSDGGGDHANAASSGSSSASSAAGATSTSATSTSVTSTSATSTGATSTGTGSADGDALFPFTGPSCTLGPPGTTLSNLACGQCEESACATLYGCIATVCADTYTCACQCPAADYINCGNLCPVSTACKTCIATVRGCTDQAGVGACVGQCAM